MNRLMILVRNIYNSFIKKIKSSYSSIYKSLKSFTHLFLRFFRLTKIQIKNIFRIIKVVISKNKGSIEVVFGFAIYTAILLIGIVLYIFNAINILELILLIFIPFLGTLISMFLYLWKKREETLLICLTSKYLLEKDESRLDDLLGVLIAGKLESLKLDPVEEFFKSVETSCDIGDVEMRRRISEALPALYKINLNSSKEIFSILRSDWDKIWKADNRRRAIESFNYLIGIDNKFILDNIKVLEKDEFITIISLLEILHSLESSTNKKNITIKIQKLKNEMPNYGFSQTQIDLLDTMWNLLKLINDNYESAVKEFLQISANGYDLHLQMFVARNFRLLCNGYPKCLNKYHCLSSTPERTIEFMNNFLSEGKHKNVRRPIAKERSLECLVIMLKNRKHRDNVKKIIWKLIFDPDDIIRITTFDKIDNILDVDKQYGLKIINHIIKQERNNILSSRAKRVLERVKNA